MKTDFYNLITDNGKYTNPDRLKYYLEEQLFKGFDFKGKSLIDIGGGNGLYGFYAAVNGASNVVVMEPEFDGSSQGMIRDFNEINKLLGNLNNITHTTKVLEEYDRENNQFDYILMHNSINHIDEEACIVLKKDEAAQTKYLDFFKLLQEISNERTNLIICDCARNNFFADLRLKNPMMPSIEWEKHQNPDFWASLLQKVGYKKESVSWTSPNQFGNLGSLFFKNRLASYFMLSHFNMVMLNDRN